MAIMQILQHLLLGTAYHKQLIIQTGIRLIKVILYNLH